MVKSLATQKIVSQVEWLAARKHLLAISRAPIEKLEAFKRRMGWNFKWLSSGGNDFNYDYQVSFTPEALEDEVEYNYAKLRPTRRTCRA
jgi:predicted dithiol-disulfide oxidoreductase (DUF899 family)